MCSMDGPRYSLSCQPDMPEGTALRCRRQRTGQEVALGIGKAHGQFTGRELRLVEGQCDDPRADVIGDAVPHSIRPRAAIVQRLWPSTLIKIAPSIKTWISDSDRQMGLLHEPDDLQLWFSRVRSATTSLSAVDSRRRSWTSSEVAARAISPARQIRQ
jgi:hypothetical protein